MAKIRISAVVNTRNEEKTLDGCLKSLDFCNEIILVDMESGDATKDIASKYTHKIFNHPNVGYVEPARNMAISKATGDWILVIDADERVPKDLAKKLVDISNSSDIDFVRIPRKNIVFGQWLKHSRWWPDLNIRFFRKGVVTWKDEIHSVPITTGVGISLEAEESVSLEHLHYQSIDEYILRSLRYSSQQATELIDSGYRFDPKDLVTKPIGEFLSRFFAGEGYKDGLHGLVMALLQFFSILLIYLKVWERQGFTLVSESKFTVVWQESFLSKFKEFKYWFLTSKIQSSDSKMGTFFLKLKRKIKI